jgi:rubrerythrin
MDVKEALKAAIQMERDGHAFYTKAAAQTSSQMGRSIFTSLAEDELLHLETFQKLFEEPIGKSEWEALTRSGKKYTQLPIFPRDLMAAEGASPDSNELDALRVAMDSERQAIDFYTTILEETGDEEVRRIIAEIIDQERSHYRLLEEEFDHLSKTGFWYELGYLGG